MTTKKLVINAISKSIDLDDRLCFHKLLSNVFKTNYGIYNVRITNGSARRIIKIVENENVETELIFSLERRILNRRSTEEEYLWLADGGMLIYVVCLSTTTTVSIGYIEEYNGTAFNISDELAIYNEIRLFEEETIAQRNNDVNLLTLHYDNLTLTPVSIPNEGVNIDTMYNDGFREFHEELIESLNQHNSKGIVFLYGEPGTGKTNYIRFLSGEIKKKIIYIPNEIVHELSQPSFISFLSEHKNSIIILEDAEHIFFDRNKVRTNTVSSLLNLTDGILSDALHIQFICTFNVGIENIDRAFLRGGRTIGIHEFKVLEAEKCNLLLSELGAEYRTEKSMPLSDIFNKKKIETEKIKIGF